MTVNALNSENGGMFETIERGTTLANRVTREIEEMIIEGRLNPGDRLPSEREIAGQFGVSRTVVREAVGALVARGLLTTLPGGGTVVSSPSAKSVSQSMTLFLRGGIRQIDHKKVQEVRRILEIEMAGLAAERRTEEDLAELQGILEEAACSSLEKDRDWFAECDVAFHLALARATHNELISLVLDSVVDIMLLVREVGFEVPQTPERAFKYHQAIFEQIKAGNREAAQKAMKAHLDEAEDTMQQALTLQAAGGESTIPDQTRISDQVRS